MTLIRGQTGESSLINILTDGTSFDHVSRGHYVNLHTFDLIREVFYVTFNFCYDY